MPADKKNRLILLLSIGLLTSLGLILNMRARLKGLEESLKRESSSRTNMLAIINSADNQTDKCFQERRALAEKVVALEADIDKERTSLGSTRKMLLDQQNRNQGLEAELAQAKNLLEVLEGELKNVLLKKEELEKQTKKKK